MAHHITGANTLLVTPFAGDGEIDLKSLSSLADFVIDSGVHGVMALGSSGEFFTLTPAERSLVARHLVHVVAGRVPVTVGIGSDSTAGAIDAARLAEESGADCVLALPPLYFDQSPEAQVIHFTAIARAVTIPVMLYDGAGGVSVSAAVIAETHRTAQNIRYVKQATPQPRRIVEILDSAPGVSPLAGDDTLLLAALRNGAVGSSTAIGNLLPSTISRLHTAYARGDLETATTLFTELMPAVLATSAPKVEFIARIKVVLAAMGVIANPSVRPPLHELDPAARDELITIMKILQII